MSAPSPRPTREQVNEALHIAYHGAVSDGIRRTLADEVRALRDELLRRADLADLFSRHIEAVHDALDVTREADAAAAVAAVQQLRAELAARTPQPAEPREVVHLCPAGDADLTPCCGKSVMAMALANVKERITVDPDLVTCGRAPQPAVPDGEDGPTDAEFDALRAAIASGRGPTPLAGEDVPARLEAVANALAPFAPTDAHRLRSLVDWMQASPNGAEVRAAVAAALAGGAR